MTGFSAAVPWSFPPPRFVSMIGLLAGKQSRPDVAAPSERSLVLDGEADPQTATPGTTEAGMIEALEGFGGG